jgi:SAM-dependent methyltransferase
MKSLRSGSFLFVNVVLILLFASCNFFIRAYHKNKDSDKNSHTNCYILPKEDTLSFRNYKNNYLRQFDFRKFDTVVCIGVGGGWREFLYSLFTDSIMFYMEDIDTTCITREKIRSIYLPYYNDFRGSPITNSFIPVSGTDTSICLKNNTANKVLIFNAYHHFTNDNAMVSECKRILKTGGKLYIGDFVMKKNKHSYRHCPIDGGNYKSEKNFVDDIVNTGFNCDTIYRSKRHYRFFVFSKHL